MKKLLMLLSVLLTGIVSMSAQHSIYINNQTGWTSVALYAWGDKLTDPLGAWPGLDPSATVNINGADYLKFDIPASLNDKSVNLIFNNHNSGSQLSDYYVAIDRDMMLTATSSALTNNNKNLLYVENKTGWDDADLHVYAHESNAGIIFGSWPGAYSVGKITEGDKTYLIFISDATTDKACSLIFNNNKGEQFDYSEKVVLDGRQGKITAVKETTPTYQENIYLTGTMTSDGSSFQIGDKLIAIPHVGEGVYKRTFTSPADFTGAQEFQLSTKSTADWGEFGTGMIQPENLTAVNQTQSYTVGETFKGNISIPECSKFTITVDMANTTMRIDIEDVEYGANMPLKPEDFNNGKKHYFFVGTRTNDFRLQPEWEFTPASDGRLVIDNRLVYPGMFAIGVVDNYPDYIYHRFKMYAKYSNGYGWDVTQDNHENLILEAAGDGVCITTDDYMNKRRPYRWAPDQDGDKTVMIFNWYNESNKNNVILLGDPVLCDHIVITLDENDMPATLSFEGCTTDKATVASRRMFSPCGSMIYNADPEVFDGTKGSTYWYVDESYNHTIKTWANAWIQYDHNYMPYVDGYGRYMAQTVFQYSAWMKNHPTYFQYPDEINGMPYSSDDILFVHYSQLDPNDPYMSYYESKLGNGTDKVRIGGQQLQKSEDLAEGQNPWNYTEQLYSFAEDGITPVALGDQARESANWQPYVVSDIWLYDEFKIWSGTSGGHLYQGRAQDDVNTLNDFLWYPENGGVDLAQSTAGVVSPTYIYRNSGEPTEGRLFNVGKHATPNNYNFKDTPRYFKRVILWYDADGGMGNSVIQFLGRYFAPVITIAKEDDNTLSYDWTIPNEDKEENSDVRLMSYSIERHVVNEDGTTSFHGYALDENGAEVRDIKVGDDEHGRNLDDMHANNEFATIHSRVDNTKLPTGTYFYVVKAKVYDNTNNRDMALDREATSTRANILASEIGTGIEDVEADIDGEAVYYDLRGIRVDNPANGTFIKVCGGKAQKINL